MTKDHEFIDSQGNKMIGKKILLISILIISFMIYNRIGDSSIKAEIKGLGTRLVGHSNKSEETEYAKISLCINNKISSKAKTKEFCTSQIFLFHSISQIRFFFDPKDDIIVAGKLKGNKLSLQYGELLKDLSFYEEPEVLRLKQNDNYSQEIKLQCNCLRKKVIPQNLILYQTIYL